MELGRERSEVDDRRNIAVFKFIFEGILVVFTSTCTQVIDR